MFIFILVQTIEFIVCINKSIKTNDENDNTWFMYMLLIV